MFLQWALTAGAPPYGSWGNGAPMRTGAVGWLAADEAEARALARAQAAVSHDHPDAMAAAEAVALATFLLRAGNPKERVRARIVAEFGYALDPDSALVPKGFDVSAAGTVVSALAAAFEAQDWAGAVRTAVRLGGDTDTLACIGVAEAAYGLPAECRTRTYGYLERDLADVVQRFEARVRMRV
jgi:ADP-ribosyl-[dinitrogen reductase] hydrolase